MSHDVCVLVAIFNCVLLMDFAAVRSFSKHCTCYFFIFIKRFNGLVYVDNFISFVSFTNFIVAFCVTIAYMTFM